MPFPAQLTDEDRAYQEEIRHWQTEGTMAVMTELVTTARREGTSELLLTSGLFVLYMSLRGTARALGAIEHVVVR